MSVYQNEKVVKLIAGITTISVLTAIGCSYKQKSNFIKYKEGYSIDEFTVQNGYVDSFSEGDPNRTIVMEKEATDTMFYVNSVTQQVNSERDMTTVLAMDFAKTYAAENPKATAENIVKETNNFISDIDKYKSQAATGEDEATKEFAKVVSLAGDAISSASVDPADKAAGETLAKAASHFTDVQRWVTGDDVKYKSQEKLASDFDHGVFNERTIVKEWKDKAPTDPRLASVDKLIIEQRVGVGVKDGAAKILDRKPMFRDTKIAAATLSGTVKVYGELVDMNTQLKNSIGPNGKLTLKVNDLNKMTKGLIEENRNAVKEQIALAKNTDANLTKLLKIEEDRTKAEAKAKEAAKKEQLTQMGFQASHSAVNVLSTILQVANVEPKAVAQFSTVAHSVIAVSEALHKFNSSNSGADAARYGTAILMGDFVGIAMGLVKVFAQTGPTPEQMILSQLVEIQKAISDLRREMHDRFDRLDRSIGEMHREMNISFNSLLQMAASISADVNDVNIQVNKIGVDLSNIKSRIIRIEELTIESTKLHADVQVRKIYNQCYEPSRLAKNSLNSVSLKECLEMIESLATDFALNGAIAEKGTATSDQTEIMERLSNSNLDSQINLLKDLANKPEYFVEELKNISSKTLPSIKYWTLATQFVNQVIVRNPKALKGLPPDKVTTVINTIYKPGNDLRYFNQIIRSEKFVKKMTEAYISDLQSFFDQDAYSLSDIWNQAVASAVGEYVQSEQSMISFTVATSSFEKLNHTMVPHNNDQRQFPTLIKKILSIKNLQVDAMIAFGWFGNDYQHYKWDGSTPYCYAVPTYELSANAKFDRRDFRIIKMTQRYQIPDHGDYRIHIRSQKPCPEITQEDLNYFMSTGGFKTYYANSISSYIATMRDNGILTSPDAKEFGLHVTKVIYLKAMENFQKIVRDTILGVNSSSNNVDFKKRLVQLEYRKKIMESFLSYAFPRSLKNRDLLYHGLFGGTSARGLIDIQGLLSESTKDPLQFRYSILNSENMQDEGVVEDKLALELQEKYKADPKSLSDEELKSLEIVGDHILPQVYTAIWERLDLTDAAYGPEVFMKDDIQLSEGLRTSLYYKKDNTKIDPIAVTKSVWLNYRVKKFTEHLYAELPKMSSEEVNIYTIYLNSLKASEKLNDLMSK